jgi:NitT/TauT family transport system substrate-binding protein
MCRILLIALSVVFTAAAHARDRVVITIGGSDKIVYLPAKLAERLGLFRGADIEVELRTENAGVEARDALLSGAVDGVVGFYDHTIALQAKGRLVESVAQLAVSTGEALLVGAQRASAVRSVGALKGRTVGVTGLGASTSFLTQYLALANGMRPGDMTLVPVGAGDRFIAAMRQGTIEAGMTTEPTVSRLLKTGEARVLVDLRTPEATVAVLGGLYPSACLYMRNAWVERNRAKVQRVVNALIGALAYIRDEDPEAIARAMPAEYHAGDRELYVRAIAAAKPMFTPDGRMPPSGPGTVLKVMQAIDANVQYKNIDLAKTYTLEFVEAAAGKRNAAGNGG